MNPYLFAYLVFCAVVGYAYAPWLIRRIEHDGIRMTNGTVAPFRMASLSKPVRFIVYLLVAVVIMTIAPIAVADYVVTTIRERRARK